MGAPQIKDWEEIEKLVIAGMSIPDAARKFGLKPNTVRVRAIRNNWPTPDAIAKRAKELTVPEKNDKVIQAAAEDWNAKGEAHRKVAFEIATESIKQFKAKPPKNFRELKAADDIARRAAGLDISEVNQQTLIMMHERVNSFEDEQPEEIIEGEVIVETIADTAPQLPENTELAPADGSSSDIPV